MRAVGAGRPSAVEADPGLLPALLASVEPAECGDPETVLRWTVKSTRNLISPAEDDTESVLYEIEQACSSFGYDF